ncbi:DEAD/DEAH box helicase family protein [bacterium]|nr:DEAD/DEAH box helicase family protein [bacterium]
MAKESPAKPQPKEPGYFRGLANMAMQGANQAEQSLLTLAASGGADVFEQLAQANQRAARIPTPKEAKRFVESKTWVEMLENLALDPIDITTQLGAQMFTQYLMGQLPLTVAGGALGSVAGPAGNITGLVAGTGLGSFAMEYAGKLMEALAEEGVDVGDADALRMAFADPKKMARVRRSAALKAGPIALADATSMGAAGKFAKAIPGITGKALDALLQAALDAGGEAAGELAAGEELSPGGIAAEVVGGLGQTAVEEAWGISRRSAAEQRKAGKQKDAEIPPGPGEPPAPATEAEARPGLDDLTDEDLAELVQAFPAEMAALRDKEKPSRRDLEFLFVAMPGLRRANAAERARLAARLRMPPGATPPVTLVVGGGAPAPESPNVGGKTPPESTPPVTPQENQAVPPQIAEIAAAPDLSAEEAEEIGELLDSVVQETEEAPRPQPGPAAPEGGAEEAPPSLPIQEAKPGEPTRKAGADEPGEAAPTEPPARTEIKVGDEVVGTDPSGPDVKRRGTVAGRSGRKGRVRVTEGGRDVVVDEDLLAPAESEDAVAGGADVAGEAAPPPEPKGAPEGKRETVGIAWGQRREAWPETVVEMSPAEYLDAAGRKFIDEQRVAELEKAMREGKDFEPVSLRRNADTGEVIEQEGRHRALAAERLGVDKIPVWVSWWKGRKPVEQPATQEKAVVTQAPGFREGDRIQFRTRDGVTRTGMIVDAVPDGHGGIRRYVVQDDANPLKDYDVLPENAQQLTQAEGESTIESGEAQSDEKGGGRNVGAEHGGRGDGPSGRRRVLGPSGVARGESAAVSGEPPAERAPETAPGGRGRPGDSGRRPSRTQPEDGPGSGDRNRIRGDRGTVEPGSAGEPAEAERPGPQDAGAIQGEDDGRVNHSIAPEDEIAPKGDVAKARANLAAIRLLRVLESENREATADEKRVLARYTGWGGLSQVFDRGKREAMEAAQRGDLHFRHGRRDEAWEKKWGALAREVHELLTEEEWERAQASTINAHYTSRSVISAMWGMARRLGFTGGTVLEPAAGVGHFFGLMPQDLAANSNLVGIELDSLSGRILAKLYPRATVFNRGFETVGLPPSSIDLAITNVPFAAGGPWQAKEQYGQDLSLHNYFIVRMLDALRPGGILLAISTHFTMDANRQQRELIAGKGDLVAAIRLPNNAFSENAGTEVTTDLLIFRKPDGGGFAWRQAWAAVLPMEMEGKTGQVNEYFHAHPENMLGTPSMEGTMYGGADEFTLKPRPGANLAEELAKATARLPENIAGSAAAPAAVDFTTLGEAEGRRENELMLSPKGDLVAVSGGKFVPASEVFPQIKGGSHLIQARAYIGLRDHYREHIRLMQDPTASEEQVEASRKKLSRLYDDYRRRFGALGGHSTKKFSPDPSYYLILSLENVEQAVDPKNPAKLIKVWRKAAVFAKRTIWPWSIPIRADSAKDAMLISMAYYGKIDPEYMARITGKGEGEIIAELEAQGAVYRDPVSGLYEPRDLYLSGNVRKKLREAQAAAEQDSAYRRNVAALEAVQPQRIGIAHVGFRLGSAWIPENIVQEFSSQVLHGGRLGISYSEAADAWHVSGRGLGVDFTETYGTPDMPADKVLAHLLNLKDIQVFDSVPDGKGGTTRVFNPSKTVAARAAAERLQEAFRSWVLANADASRQIEDAYNEKFNFYVVPQFDGSHLTLPGSSVDVALRPYQKNLVWRLIQQGAGLIAHAVGAGKTYSMIATAMELRRLGLARKPLLVVQNATLPQFAASFRQMYPGANVLVATKEDLESSRRRQFVGRIASGDWDAVIMAQSSFGLIENDPRRMAAWVQEMIRDLEQVIEEASEREGKKAPTVKQLVKQKKRLEDRLDRLMAKVRARADGDVYFDDLGVDALFLDEAHAYKKPPFVTKLPKLVGLETQESQRAFDVLMKARYIQDHNRGRGVYLATGTPVTNTLGEAWHLTNIMAPDVIKEWGITTFDRFVSAFARVSSVHTMNAAMKWVFKNALAKYTNGPELMAFIRSRWDILSTQNLRAMLSDMGNGMPEVAGGGTQSVAVERTAGVSKFVAFLGEVMQAFSGLSGDEKKQHSYIPILLYNAGKKAALDIRLVEPNAADEPNSKVNIAIQKVLEIYRAGAKDKTTQMVFCDSYNPMDVSLLRSFAERKNISLEIEPDDAEGEAVEGEADLWLFRDITRKLVKAGVPKEEIAVINDYKTDAQRAKLFEAMNAGTIRVLLGGTQKMGVGVNVQERLKALHHLDAPWLPSDVEQREGRIIRYGNTNAVVEVYSYGMKSTLDAAIWGANLRKASFIQQLWSGNLQGREFDDPFGGVILSAREQMAAYADDPRIFRKLDLEAEVRALSLEQEAWTDSQARQAAGLKAAEDRIPTLERNLETWQEINRKAEHVGAAPFVAEIEGVEYADRKEAEKALDAALVERIKAVFDGQKALGVHWGGQQHDAAARAKVALEAEIAGYQVRVHVGAHATGTLNASGFQVTTWNPTVGVEVRFGDVTVVWSQAQTGRGVLLAIRRAGEEILNQVTTFQRHLERTQEEAERLRASVGQPFPKAAELRRAQAELEDLNHALTDGHAQVGGADTERGVAMLMPEEIASAFPGSLVERKGRSGYRVLLPNGAEFGAQWVSDIAADRERIRREYGDAVADDPEIVVAGHWQFTGVDGNTTGALGLLRLLLGEADDATLRHERVHVARSLGLFSEGEWQALVDEYAPGETDPGRQEEMIARVAETATDSRGRSIWQRVRDFILRLFGIATPRAAEILAQLDAPGFWSRPVRGVGKVQEHYSIGPPDEDARRRMLLEMDPVEVDTSAFAGIEDAGEIRRVARVEYRRISRQRPKTRDGHSVIFEPAGLKKTQSQSADLRIVKIIPSLPALLSGAVRAWSEAPGPGDRSSIKAWHHYGVKATLEGERVYIRLTLRERHDGTFYYDNHVTHARIIEEGPSSRSTPLGNAGDGPSEPSGDRLYNWLHDFKPKGGSYQVKKRTRGRPDLANPAMTEESRAFVDDVDERRTQVGRPERRADDEVGAAAEQLLARPDARAYLLNRMETGMLSDVETVAAQRVVAQETLEVLTPGATVERVADVQRLVWAWRQSGSEQARAFRQRRDRFKTPAQRAADAISEMISEPDPKDEKVIKQIDEEMRKAASPEEIERLRKQKDRIIKRMASEIVRLRQLLVTRGFDMERLREILANPDEAYRMEDEISAARSHLPLKLVEFWKAGLLSGTATHVRNLVGNTANAFWEFTIQRFAEAAWNALAVGSPDQAQFGEFKYLLHAMKPGFARGVRNLLASWRTERPMFEDEIMGSTAGGNRAIDSHRAAIGGKLGRTIRVPFRALLAMDEFQKSIVGEMEAAAVAYRIAKAEGLAGAALQSRMSALLADTSSVAWTRGVETAIDLTFQRDLGKVGQKVMELRRVAWPLHFLVPFLKTNVNIYKAGLRRSTARRNLRRLQGCVWRPDVQPSNGGARLGGSVQQHGRHHRADGAARLLRWRQR